MDQHREVQVIARGEAGHARAAERFALAHALSGRHSDLGEMRVERREPQAMVEHDHVAVDAVLAGEQDLAGA